MGDLIAQINDLWEKIQDSKSKSVKFTQVSSSQSSIDLTASWESSPKGKVFSIFNTLKELNTLKRNFFMVQNNQEFLNNDQYQEALQNLEAEVRNHIKIQQQLRLFIESQQSKLEDLEKSSINKDSTDMIAALEKENAELQATLKKKEAECEKLKASSIRAEILSLKLQSKKNAETLAELEIKKKSMKELLQETEIALEKQKNMCTTLKQENEKLKNFLNRNKSAERDRLKMRRIIAIDASKKNLLEKKGNNRSLSPCISQQQTLSNSKSNNNLHSKKRLIRDESIEKIHTERQFTSKRKL